MARLALKQGLHDSARTIVDHLLAHAGSEDASELEALRQEILGARRRFERAARYDRILGRLDACLRRARALRRTRTSARSTERPS